jgi:hypothetical protein
MSNRLELTDDLPATIHRFPHLVSTVTQFPQLLGSSQWQH